MKEQNLERAMKVTQTLENRRSMLEVLNSNEKQEFSIISECKRTSNGYSRAHMHKDVIPEYIRDVTICLMKSELEKQIKALEAELETL